MSATTQNPVRRSIAAHKTVMSFLVQHEAVLTRLGYASMAEKFGDENLSYLDFHTGESEIFFTAYGPTQRELMRTLRRAIGGKWDKYGGSSKLYLTRQWGDHADSKIGLTISGNRDQVCERVVTGTREVHHEAVPAQEARTEVVEEVDWVCGNLLEDDAA
jgi:hypothetical protein